jgi:hypothetical protein
MTSVRGNTNKERGNEMNANEVNIENDLEVETMAGYSPATREINLMRRNFTPSLPVVVCNACTDTVPCEDCLSAIF